MTGRELPPDDLRRGERRDGLRAPAPPGGGVVPSRAAGPGQAMRVTSATAAGPDPAEPYEIAPRLWWVGCYLEGDAFQCHSYLIEHGDQSVLIDPGSRLTFAETRRKIERVVAFRDIRWFVCQHADPDIVSAIDLFDAEVVRADARLLTHWRTAALLRHYDWRIPMQHVDACDWQLDLGERLLRFVFTPYLHFPGAFCTFDETSGVLFSSDLFGGFTSGFQLFAEDEAYFEALRPFHEHYMPSREHLQYGLAQIRRHALRLIAPQHGSIIPEALIGPILERLQGLECGLLARAGDLDVLRLARLNSALDGIDRAVIEHRALRDIVAAMEAAVRGVLPEAGGIEVRALDGDGRCLYLGERTRFRARPLGADPQDRAPLGRPLARWLSEHPRGYALRGFDGGAATLTIALQSDAERDIGAVATLRLDRMPAASMLEIELPQLVQRIATPLQISVERALLREALELDRRRYYQQAVRDALTGLFTRYYMDDAAGRLLDLHERDDAVGFAVVMFDVDHFKAVNDNHGHGAGDAVLRRLAGVILEVSRRVDIPVRLGGEEFAVFLAGCTAAQAQAFAERVRSGAAALRFDGALEALRITFSAGIAEHAVGESLEALIERADRALYEAKRAGRDRVRVAGR